MLLCAIPAHAQGSLTPTPKQTFFDDSGNALAGGLVYTYAAGTTTPLSTYSDSALTTANANPIVLDSAGRATIYLGFSNYKFVVKTSAGVTVYTQDNVPSTGLLVMNGSSNGVCEGRLTVLTETPVPTSDLSLQPTVYWTPYKGNRIALYDGANWRVYTFSELSISTGSQTDKNFDVFAYVSSGAVALEKTVWTSDTVRSENLILVDGVWLNGEHTTRRYLGTFRTNSTATVDDKASRRALWNYYNRVRKAVGVTEQTDSWTYTTATYRQARAQTANKVEIVLGVLEQEIDINVLAFASNTNAGVGLAVSVGEDSTTTSATGVIGMSAQTTVANIQVPLRVQLRKIPPAAGFHFYAWLELSAATGTTTWQGDGGSPTTVQSGMFGFWEY